jgi:hypothetical protein
VAHRDGEVENAAQGVRDATLSVVRDRRGGGNDRAGGGRACAHGPSGGDRRLLREHGGVAGLPLCQHHNAQHRLSCRQAVDATTWRCRRPRLPALSRVGLSRPWQSAGAVHERSSGHPIPHRRAAGGSSRSCAARSGVRSMSRILLSGFRRGGYHRRAGHFVSGGKTRPAHAGATAPAATLVRCARVEMPPYRQLLRRRHLPLSVRLESDQVHGWRVTLHPCVNVHQPVREVSCRGSSASARPAPPA